ncbi:MAG: hypothetical protein ACYTG6_14330, partial [Planctomycetota bacterium]
VYVAISLLFPRPFDLEGLLKRKDDPRHQERVVLHRKGWRTWFRLGLDNPEFTRRDKVLYVLTYIWTGIQVSLFVAGTTIALTLGISKGFWLSFWKVYVIVLLALSAVVIVWFTVGGVRDLAKMTAALRTLERDPSDDGWVEEKAPPPR